MQNENITKFGSNFIRSQWNSTSPSIGIHGNQLIGQEMRNDNKNDYNVIRRDSKISSYGTAGKVIINANHFLFGLLSWGNLKEFRLGNLVFIIW